MLHLEDRIVFEDNHLLIFNKIPGEIVQGDKTGDIPLVDLLKKYLKKKYEKPGNVFLGLAHRLDRPTSGLLIFCKTSKALTRINLMLQKHEIKKTYWAVTENELNSKSGKFVDYLKKNEKQNKSYAVKQSEKDAKRAVLNFEFKANSTNYFLYEINLETGRHHQIRAQLSTHGACIKGDLKYGASRSNKDGSIHLHAYKLDFEHPIKKEPVSIKSKPPVDPVWDFFSNLLS